MYPQKNFKRPHLLNIIYLTFKISKNLHPFFKKCTFSFFICYHLLKPASTQLVQPIIIHPSTIYIYHTTNIPQALWQLHNLYKHFTFHYPKHKNTPKTHFFFTYEELFTRPPALYLPIILMYTTPRGTNIYTTKFLQTPHHFNNLTFLRKIFLICKKTPKFQFLY